MIQFQNYIINGQNSHPLMINRKMQNKYLVDHYSYNFHCIRRWTSIINDTIMYEIVLFRILQFCMYFFIHTYHCISGWSQSIRKDHPLGLMQYKYKSLSVNGLLFKIVNFSIIYLKLLFANRARNRQSGTHKGLACPSSRLSTRPNAIFQDLYLLVKDVFILNWQLCW